MPNKSDMNDLDEYDQMGTDGDGLFSNLELEAQNSAIKYLLARDGVKEAGFVS